MRIVGLDVSRSVAEIASLVDGTLHAGGCTGLRRDELERFAVKLRSTDHVVLEATGNTTAIVNVLRPHVARVAIANPLQVRLIAEARVKTDKIDAAVLAQLYAQRCAVGVRAGVSHRLVGDIALFLGAFPEEDSVAPIDDVFARYGGQLDPPSPDWQATLLRYYLQPDGHRPPDATDRVSMKGKEKS